MAARGRRPAMAIDLSAAGVRASAPAASIYRELGIAVFVTVAMLAPFLNKAVHIDDPLFIWSAEQILKDPSDFFGCEVNWYGRPQRLADVTKNPPLTCYYLAAAIAIGGVGEIALHTAMLLPAILATVAIYLIAERLCKRPLLATLMCTCSPAFVVSSTTLMCDTMQLAFWCAAIALWIWPTATSPTATRPSKYRALFDLAAVLCISAAALSKYFGIALVPLLAAQAVLETRRAQLRLAWLAVPLVVLAAFEAYGRHKYGHGLVLSAADYATQWGSSTGSWLSRGVIGLSFLGGAAIFVPLWALWLWSGRALSVAAAATLVVGVVWILGVSSTAGAAQLGEYQLHKDNGFNWPVLVHCTVFAAIGIALVVLMARDWQLAANAADAALLALWIAGTLLFAVGLNWTINIRSLLPLVPAAAILVARQLDRQADRMPRILRAVLLPDGDAVWVALVPLVIISLAVAWGDCNWANSARQAANQIAQQFGPQAKRIWFQGHWGFQYYMMRDGGVPFDIRDDLLSPGELMVLPENNTSLYDLSGLTLDEGKPLWLERGKLEVPLKTWAHTGCQRYGASFYSSTRGPLPFAVGPPVHEWYRLFEAQRIFRMQIEIE